MALDTLGARLKHAREARKRGSAELSIAIGASHGLVSEVERGRSKSLQAETAIVLARALDVPVEWLVLGEGPDPIAAAKPSAAKPSAAKAKRTKATP